MKFVNFIISLKANVIRESNYYGSCNLFLQFRVYKKYYELMIIGNIYKFINYQEIS